MKIIHQEALDERVKNLVKKGLNGIALVLVNLQPEKNPIKAILTVHFFNKNELINITNDIKADPTKAKSIFPITGGHRILAGPLTDQIQVVNVVIDPKNDKILQLTIEPIGDYSTYTLNVAYKNIDPILSAIDFKFRPDCFNNCPPDWKAPPAPRQDPAIDYLNKDYDSFRHTLMAWMGQRVPNWQPTSEADLDQVLLELFSVAGDELSDYQDRVMNEAYLATARKRVSLARHARLVDYHIHQGNQASTHLVLTVNESLTLKKDFQVTANGFGNSNNIVFINRDEQTLDPLLNEVSLYTWSDTTPALAAGSTSADLKLSKTGKAEAEKVQKLIRKGIISHLVIQEHINPLTGEVRGFNPEKRQLLTLLSGNEGAKALKDPLTGSWFVRVNWCEEDELKNNYCFTVNCPNGMVKNVSLFHGNVVKVYHGFPQEIIFKDPSEILNPSAVIPEYHYEKVKRRIGGEVEREVATLCHLPNGPLAYWDTIPGGEVPSQSTVEVTVDGDAWDEVISLLHSDDSAEGGDHFVVEIDEEGNSLLRFGNGVNGRQLPERAVVKCKYQVGAGAEGNVGADVLANFDAKAFPEIENTWNPFDVTNGKEPEPAAEVIRRAPEAYRFRQLRAVTLQDYQERAEELPEVSRAAARYMWTGSWRTVRITIDPISTTTFQKIQAKVAQHLEAVRLLGEDLEIRPPRFVPLEIKVSLCIKLGYWPEDVRFMLEQEFSEGYTPSGQQAFFHPDLWTFGQPLRKSRILGRVQAIQGVDHVRNITMKRFNEVTPGTSDSIEVVASEIIQVRNNPDHMEQGSIHFDFNTEVASEA